MTVPAAQTAARASSEMDALADSHLLAEAELDPLLATSIGLKGFEHRMPDLSPDGLAARADLRRDTLARLSKLSPTDDVDKVTLAALSERLMVDLDLHELGASLSSLNNIASPVQNLRDTFDLMATDTVEDWTAVAARMAALPDAMEGYLQSLRLAASRGHVSPSRQVRACIVQSEANLGEDGFFATFTGQTPSLPDSLRVDLERASAAAQASYSKLRDYLREELLAQAPERDAIGEERYLPHSRKFLGTSLDLAEAYDWGQAELARITGLMAETAGQIKPGASVDEAIEHLDSDPANRLVGAETLRAWMQEQSDAAMDALAGTHFDIPDPVRRLQCMIAPTNTGVIYYTGPSDDFSRPGQMWWSVPAGVTEFSTWRELTTVYHEGVPGHHLQIAQTVHRRELLNNWRRLAAWTSGHGEGWALYAEWLMADLGFMDAPANRLGLLDGQSLRAARVVIDIGVHCDFDAPAEVGGGAWTYDKAWQLLRTHAHMGEELLRYELDRYLGWPGQAPSYKIGERRWLELRDEARARAGSSFDLKAFHRQALDLGGVGLDVLRAGVLGEL
jgi:uncharacterized protein (DUF885 family)